SLLTMAIEQQPLRSGSTLNVLLFSDARGATLDQISALGAEVLGESRSPFGPLLHVRAPADSLPALAGLTGVQEIEIAHSRVAANDLSRARVGVAVDSTITTNYLNLTGLNVLVNVNDSGADTNHPDLTGRVTVDVSGDSLDMNGHGTFV